MNENKTNEISAVFGNGKSTNIINDPGYGPFDFDKDHIKNIQDTVSSIIKERIKDLKEKSKRSDKNYEAYQIDQIDENFALQQGYTAIGSDFHGDFWSLYAFLVQCGYLIPDKEKFLFVHLAKTKDGEQDKYKITYEFSDPGKYNFADEKEKGNYVLALPGFKVNENFRGTIELLGDYIDRGKESLMCLTLLDYLTRLEKQKYDATDYAEEKRLNVHRGNHEYAVHNGLYGKSNLITQLIQDMGQDSRMNYSSFRKKGDKYESFSHTSLCKKHVYNIIGILKVFYQIADGNVGKDHESIQKVKENFERMKKDDRYKTLFDKLEQNLSKESIDKNKKLKKIVNKYFEAYKKRKQKNNTILNNNKFYRWLCLSALEAELFNDQIEHYCGDDFKKFLFKSENQLKGYSLLKEILAEEDYFLLRNFIADVVPFDTYKELQRLKKNDPFYTSKKIQIAEDKILTVNAHYFNSLSPGDPYWPLWERYSPSLGETFKSVTQFVGHDAVYNENHSFGPYVKNGLGNDKSIGADGPMHIICVDTLRSHGYHLEYEKNYKGKKRHFLQSDSMLVIRTPDEKYLMEKFSIVRSADGKILKDDLYKRNTYMLLSQNEAKFVKGRTDKDQKHFSSIKNQINAFYDVKKNIGTDGNKDNTSDINTDVDTDTSTKVFDLINLKTNSERVDPLKYKRVRTKKNPEEKKDANKGIE